MVNQKTVEEQKRLSAETATLVAKYKKSAAYRKALLAKKAAGRRLTVSERRSLRKPTPKPPKPTPKVRYVPPSVKPKHKPSPQETVSTKKLTEKMAEEERFERSKAEVASAWERRFYYPLEEKIGARQPKAPASAKFMTGVLGGVGAPMALVLGHPEIREKELKHAAKYPWETAGEIGKGVLTWPLTAGVDIVGKARKGDIGGALGSGATIATMLGVSAGAGKLSMKVLGRAPKRFKGTAKAAKPKIKLKLKKKKALVSKKQFQAMRKAGIIDKTGKVIKTPKRKTKVLISQEQFDAMRKAGIIDKTGKVIKVPKKKVPIRAVPKKRPRGPKVKTRQITIPISGIVAATKQKRKQRERAAQLDIPISGLASALGSREGERARERPLISFPTTPRTRLKPPRAPPILRPPRMPPILMPPRAPPTLRPPRPPRRPPGRRPPRMPPRPPPLFPPVSFPIDIVGKPRKPRKRKKPKYGRRTIIHPAITAKSWLGFALTGKRKVKRAGVRL